MWTYTTYCDPSDGDSWHMGPEKMPEEPCCKFCSAKPATSINVAISVEWNRPGGHKREHILADFAACEKCQLEVLPSVLRYVKLLSK